MGVLMENHHSFFCCLPKHMSWFIMIPNKYRASTWGWVMIEHGLDPRHTHMNVEPWARSGVISTSSLPLGCQGRGNTCFWAFGSSPKKHWSHQSDSNFKANPKNMYCFNCFVFFHYFRAIPLFVWIMTVYNLEGEEEFLENDPEIAETAAEAAVKAQVEDGRWKTWQADVDDQQLFVIFWTLQVLAYL